MAKIPGVEPSIHRPTRKKGIHRAAKRGEEWAVLSLKDNLTLEEGNRLFKLYWGGILEKVGRVPAFGFFKKEYK